MLKKTILIVDDSEFNRRVIADILSTDYITAEATNGIEAIDYLFNAENEVSLVILDIMMPQLNGIEVMKIIKSNTRTAHIPVIMLTAADSNEEYCFKLGAIDFIKKPFNQNVVLSRVNAQIGDNGKFISEESDNNDSYFDFFTSLLYSLMEIPDLKRASNLDRINRCRRITHTFVADVCQKVGGEYEPLSRQIEKISNVMPLRDIGKFMLPSGILQKKDITSEEFDEIKNHCKYGIEILNNFPKSENIQKAILTDIIQDHHENYDGTGYPNGKINLEISPLGKIASIIDCYMAMTEKRIYRAAFAHEEVIQYILSQKNKKFDGRLADIFATLPLKIYNIKK